MSPILESHKELKVAWSKVRRVQWLGERWNLVLYQKLFRFQSAWDVWYVFNHTHQSCIKIIWTLATFSSFLDTAGLLQCPSFYSDLWPFL